MRNESRWRRSWKRLRLEMENGEELEFFVLEQTKINGATYILVTDSEEDDAECLILKETGVEEQTDKML